MYFQIAFKKAHHIFNSKVWRIPTPLVATVSITLVLIFSIQIVVKWYFTANLICSLWTAGELENLFKFIESLDLLFCELSFILFAHFLNQAICRSSFYGVIFIYQVICKTLPLQIYNLSGVFNLNKSNMSIFQRFWVPCPDKISQPMYLPRFSSKLFIVLFHRNIISSVYV